MSESPKNPTITVPVSGSGSDSNNVTSFIEQHKWKIGGAVLLIIVMFLLYKFYFNKSEKFNQNALTVQDSEQFNQEEDHLGKINEQYESEYESEENK